MSKVSDHAARIARCQTLCDDLEALQAETQRLFDDITARREREHASLAVPPTTPRRSSRRKSTTV